MNGNAGSEIGFDVLPGRSGSGALAWPASEEASRLAAALTALALNTIRSSSTLAPASRTTSCRLARACDHCLIVANDEPTSMT